jgi:hypothetical protein
MQKDCRNNPCHARQNNPCPVGRPYAGDFRFGESHQSQSRLFLRPSGALAASIASGGPSKGHLTSMDGGNAKGLLGRSSASCVRGISASDLHGRRKCRRIVGTIPAMHVRTILACPGADARLAALRFPCSHLQVQGSPSVVNPFSGTKVHGTFVFYPLHPSRAPSG